MYNMPLRMFAMKMPQQCFYKTLNVSTKATSQEIKEAYYKLAKQYHPDIQSLDEDNSTQKTDSSKDPELFKLMSEAYSVLNNPKLKAEYDNMILGERSGYSKEYYYNPNLKRSEQQSAQWENRGTPSFQFYFILGFKC